MMICGRFETPLPSNSSTLTTLSIVKRSTDCAGLARGNRTSVRRRAGRPGKAGRDGRESPTRLTCPARPTCPSNVRRNEHIASVGHDAGKGARERADDFRVEFGAGAAPQLLKRLVEIEIGRAHV